MIQTLFTSVSVVLDNWGLAEMACISELLFRLLLARATFRFLWMTSVSGVPTLSPGLDFPPGVSNSPSASLTTGTVHVFTTSQESNNTFCCCLLGPNLDIERWPEKLVSAEEARGSIQLQRGLFLKGVPSAALLVLFGGADVLFRFHLIQHRVKHFAPEAT